MDEEKKTQEIQEEAKGQVPQAPAPESERSPLEEAKETAARIEKGNAELKKLLERQEKLVAEAMITGKSFAGQTSKTPTQADKAQEFFAGSEISKAIEKHKNEI